MEWFVDIVNKTMAQYHIRQTIERKKKLYGFFVTVSLTKSIKLAIFV